MRVAAKEMPNPARLKAPVGTPAEEAAVVWRELLVARHLTPEDLETSGGTMRRQLPQPMAPGMRDLEGSGAPVRIADLRRTSAHVDGAASMAPWLGGGLTVVSTGMRLADAVADLRLLGDTLPAARVAADPRTRPRYTGPRSARSSSGLGHRPLTAAARVRIPYAPLLIQSNPFEID